MQYYYAAYIPKFTISQSEGVSTVSLSFNIKSLTRYGYNLMVNNYSCMQGFR